MAGVNLGSATGYLKLDISNFKNGIRTANTELKNGLKDSESESGKRLNSIAGKMQSAGATLTKKVTLPIVGFGTAAVVTTMNFDKQMSKVSAISGATGKDLEKLRKKAIEMGDKTKFSAKESGEAFEYMAMAGWKTGDMLEGIEGVMNLAAASGEDLGTTSDIVTDALTAFGMSAKDSGHFADVLAAASSNANTNVSMLGESFKYVAPVAGALGMSAEDVSIALGLMANSGIKASQAGTSLRTGLLNLVKPASDAAAGAIEKLGISAVNADGSMKPLKVVMDDLRKKFKGMTEEEQAYYASLIFGKEAMSGMLAIINASDEDYQKLTKSVYGADGAAKKMAETMQNNLSGQITTLKSKLETLFISFGEIMVPFLTKVVIALQHLVAGFTAMPKPLKIITVGFGLLLAAIGPTLSIVAHFITNIQTIASVAGKVLPIISKLSGVFSIFRTVAVVARTALMGIAGVFGSIVSVVGAPVLIVVGIVGALVAAFVVLYKKNEAFRNFVKGAWEGIKNAVANAISIIIAKFTAFKDGIKKIPEFFKELPNKIKEKFTQIINNIIQWKNNMVNKARETGTSFVNGFINFFKNLPYKAGYVIGTVIGTVAKFVVDMVAKAKETGTKFVTTVIQFIKDLPNKIKNVCTQAIQTVTSWTQQMIQKGKQAGTDFVNGVINFVKNLPTKVKQFTTQTINNITTWATQTVAKGKKAGTDFVNGVISFVKNLPTKIKSLLNSAITACNNFVTGLKNKGVAAARNLVNAVVSGVSSLPSKMVSIGSNIVSGVWRGIQGAAGSFRSQVANFFSGIVKGVKNAMGIKSPSTVMADEVGQYLPQGVEKGFTDAMPDATDGMLDALNGAKAKIKSAAEMDNLEIEANAKINTNSLETGKDLSGIANATTSTVEGAQGKLTSLFASFDNAITEMLESNKNAITQEKTEIEDVFIGDDNIVDNIDGALGDLEDSILDFTDESDKDIVNFTQSVQASSVKVTQEVNKLKVIFAGFTEYFKMLLGEFRNSVADCMNNTNAVIASGCNNMIDTMQNAANRLSSMAAQMRATAAEASRISISTNTATNSGYSGVLTATSSVSKNSSSSNVGTGGFAAEGGVLGAMLAALDKKTGGDTFIFNSPKALNEVEAARQMKTTKNNVVQGF